MCDDGDEDRDDEGEHDDGAEKDEKGKKGEKGKEPVKSRNCPQTFRCAPAYAVDCIHRYFLRPACFAWRYCGYYGWDEFNSRKI